MTPQEIKLSSTEIYLTSDFKNYGFNIGFKADHFTLINTPKTSNQLFYGKLNIDSDIKLKGDLNSPSVETNLTVNKETDLSVVLPSTDPEVVSREGVVKFIDKDHPQDTIKAGLILPASVNRNYEVLI